MSASRLNWGVPDWRSGAGYPAPDAPIRVWRWQFLRRRPDYREDWHLYHEPTFRRNMEMYQSLPVPEGVTSWADHFSRIAEMPGVWDEDSGTLICGHIVKYGVSFLLDPAVDDPPLNLFGRPKEAQMLRLEERHTSTRYKPLKVLELRSSLERAGLQRKDAHRLIESDMQRERREIRKKAGIYSHDFDLTEPLAPQFKQATFQLGAIQEELYGGARKQRKQRKHQAKWPLYLRVLDARDAGETYQKIGEELMPLAPDLKGEKLSAKQYDRKQNRIFAAKNWAKDQHDQAVKVGFKVFP